MFLNKKNMNDIIIWSIIFSLISISFFCFYYFSNYLMITRLFLLLLVFFIVFLLFLKTSLGKLYWNYVLESFREIHYIKWPSRKEAMQTTMMICLVVTVMGLILCLIDLLFFNFIKWVANFG